MIQKNKFAFALLGMLMAPAVQAQAEDFKPYFGIGLGAIGVEEKAATFNQKNTVFGGFVKGGVDYNDYLGAELRIGTSMKGSKSYPAGTVAATASKVDLSAEYFVAYLLKLQAPITSQLTLYALGGGTTAKFKTAITSGTTSVSTKATKIGASYGAGFNYSLGDQSSVGAEWVQYWTNVKITPTEKAKIWSATLNWSQHF